MNTAELHNEYSSWSWTWPCRPCPPSAEPGTPSRLSLPWAALTHSYHLACGYKININIHKSTITAIPIQPIHRKNNKQTTQLKGLMCFRPDGSRELLEDFTNPTVLFWWSLVFSVVTLFFLFSTLPPPASIRKTMCSISYSTFSRCSSLHIFSTLILSFPITTLVSFFSVLESSCTAFLI